MLKCRFVTAASLFDGHDAAINIMRRILQSSGAEVIHLGHNRSVDEIVKAAIQEDAQAIAISSYQGGHVEFFKYMVDTLKAKNASHIRIFAGGGGTITPDEIIELEKYGVCKIFSPEDGRKLGLQGIIDTILKNTPPYSSAPPSPSESQMPPNDKTIAQTLTRIELGENNKSFLSENKSTSFVVGLTGTGGAGKSSLTDEIVLRVLNSEPQARIAILAVDPTRQKTGGALLGDRLRVNSLQNPRVFMRSFATREANASLSHATKESIYFLKSCSFDWIFLETGGIGQSDTSIVGLSDITLYVMTSEFGAPTQLEKINMLDYADIVVINKFEKSGSLDALVDVRKQFRRNHLEFDKVNPETFPIFGTVASRFQDQGVNLLFNHLKKVKNSEKKRVVTETPFNPTILNLNSLVPKERNQYLSEISKAVKNYHKKTEENITLLKKQEAYETLQIEDNTNTQEFKDSIIPELQAFDKLRAEYQKDHFTFAVRDKKISVPLTYESLSQNKIRKIALPNFRSKTDTYDFLRKVNLPGYFPYTAGVYPFKRTEEDPKRMFAGEGTPERTNKRFHFLCKGEKAKRLSTAFDSVTLYGEDPDPRLDIFGKIGESGVSVCSLSDTKKLYNGFDLTDPNVSVSMTINGPAPILLAFYFNTAIDQQVALFEKDNQNKKVTEAERNKIKEDTLKKVRGTVQADILKEDQAQNTCIFSTEFALRMMGDIQQYFIDHGIKNYYSVSISGYHMAEAGATPITQLAFTLANGFTLAEYYLSRGMKIDEFAPNFSFFFSNALDAEYAVIGRVARRIWAIAMKNIYHANDRSQKLKYHIQTSGRSLHAQEISFNDIRTTLQALLANMDNCNSLHTNAYDEAVTTPTEESVRRAMAIQLIISKEFGMAKCENPVQGSYFIEDLTDLVEEAILVEFERLSSRGGVLGAMETHYQRTKIQEESMHYETQKHSGVLPIVGVNTYLNPNPDSSDTRLPNQLTRANYDEKNEQIKNLKAFQEKNASQSKEALQKLKEAAINGANVFEALMETSRYCSLGQMTQALYEVGGKYRRGV